MRKIWIRIAESCLHSKKNCIFDINYGINDLVKTVSVFGLILLRLKKMSLKKSSPKHYYY